MKRVAMLAGAVLLAVAAIVGYSALFTVHETRQALVLQFGAPIRVIKDPGLHVKLPFVQNVEEYDDRILDYNLAPQEIPTLDQKQVVVDSFVRYRIVDPLEFYKTVNSEIGVEARLNDIISSNLRRVFGGVILRTVLSDERSSLLDSITNSVSREAETFGLNVVDVRIRRVDLPEENSQAIYRRMQTQREQEARKFRAEGQRDARFIKADADKSQRVIVAEARKKAEILRGEGDAGATAIYNDAYGQDPQFFDFYRSMQALQKGLDGQTTSYVGAPEGDFFRFFGGAAGATGGIGGAGGMMPPGTGPQTNLTQSPAVE